MNHLAAGTEMICETPPGNEIVLILKVERLLGRAFALAERHFKVFLIGVFLASCAINLYFASFNWPLREDAYAYLLKSIEISQGNFVPIKTHAIGWSLFLAPFMIFRQDASIFDNMVYATTISSVVASLCIFPFAMLTRRFLDTKVCVLLALLFPICTPLIKSAESAYTEPLFSLLLLAAINLIFAARDKPAYWLLAAGVSAAMFCIRPNGVLMLPVLVVCFFLYSWQCGKLELRSLVGMVFVFALASTPFLVQRAYHFGSPMSYGANNKYFVDNPGQIWSDNIPAPSFVDYLKTHTVSDYFDKFIARGLCKVAFAYAYYTIPAFLIPFFCYGFVLYAFRRHVLPLLLMMGIWIGGFSIVFHVLGSARYLAPTIPLMLLFAGLGIRELTRDRSYQHMFLSILVLVAMLPFAFRVWDRERGITTTTTVKDGLKWAEWVAENVQGKIAIIEGGDLIMMHLPDTTVSARGITNLEAPQSKVSIFRPGWFDDSVESMAWLHEQGMTHIAFDQMSIKRRPALVDLADEARAGNVPYLKKIYSNFDTDSRWKIAFFEVDWEIFQQ